MICPRPRQLFLTADEETRLNSFAPNIVKVLRPDAALRAPMVVTSASGTTGLC